MKREGLEYSVAGFQSRLQSFQSLKYWKNLNGVQMSNSCISSITNPPCRLSLYSINYGTLFSKPAIRKFHHLVLKEMSIVDPSSDAHPRSHNS
ncbi:hypothetical protein EYC84_004545 [Monilinia fructicola]|uniref:Uncharacterized protein n=1 Tax=Monilinia fructicola TaxID=38448 RepID=A0A5M9K0R4_MONFR|nr:hypothetical protein EYC84_004545 [Monilinia fructicola]